MADSVEFVGDGRLVVSEAKRLTHLSGFTGTLVWAGDAALSPTDTTLVQLRNVELADGASLNYAEKTLSANPAIKIKDWNEAPASWLFGGTSGSHGTLAFDTRLGHANDDGSLALVTDPKQYHSAIYTGRKLKIHDNWGVSFHYEPSIPSDSAVSRAGWTSEWSGTFGFYMIPDANIVGELTMDLPLTKLAHGFRTYLYEGGSLKRNLGWIRGAAIDKKINDTDLQGVGGPNLRQPMDVTVSCRNGYVFVTLRQEDRYFVLARNAKDNNYLMCDIPDGFYLAFGASSDWWTSAETTHHVPWSKHTVSNFRGWYRAREAGRWVQDARSFYPFTTSNCTARRYTAASTTLAAAASTVVGGDIVYTGDVPATGLTLSGSVTRAGETTTFTVPESWKRCKTVINLLNAPTDALPTTVRIVTDTGADLTARGQVKVADGRVTVDFARGLLLLVR